MNRDRERDRDNARRRDTDRRRASDAAEVGSVVQDGERRAVGDGEHVHAGGGDFVEGAREGLRAHNGTASGIEADGEGNNKGRAETEAAGAEAWNMGIQEYGDTEGQEAAEKDAERPGGEEDGQGGGFDGFESIFDTAAQQDDSPLEQAQQKQNTAKGAEDPYDVDREEAETLAKEEAHRKEMAKAFAARKFKQAAQQKAKSEAAAAAAAAKADKEASVPLSFALGAGNR